jgi:hypothetical protein
MSGYSAGRTFTNALLGYNHNEKIEENQFFDMTNMSSDLKTIASPRKRRGLIRTFGTPNGLFGKEKLAWVDGTQFYYNGSVQGTVANNKKHFVGMGAYIIIFPDNLAYNTETQEIKPLGTTFSTVGTTTFTLTKIDGENYENYAVSNTAPIDPSNGDLWLDTSQTPSVLKQYSSYSGFWVQITNTYIKITSTGIGGAFEKYDGVTLSGINAPMDAYNTDMQILEKGANYIVVANLHNFTSPVSQSTAITVARKIPDMAFVAECNNRLWGCSTDGREIYACKLGDPFNWNVFSGIASDSYAATVGTDGKFTGVASYRGSVYFFKENCIHPLEGNKPANYQLTQFNVAGVEAGSEKSLVSVNEVLYYKSVDGICAFSGAYPSLISEEFGLESYKNAVAGAIGSKYYVSMQGTDGYYLFVYDSSIGVWHKEDNTQVLDFARVERELYFVNAETKMLTSVLGTTDLYKSPTEESKLEPPVKWTLETGDWNMDSPDQAYINKVVMRVFLAENAFYDVYVMYESSGEWELVRRVEQQRKRSSNYPLRIKRADHMKLKIEGEGYAKIYSMSKQTEYGSEVKRD